VGGYSSGRYRTRNRANVEQTLTLSMRRLRQLGYLEPGVRRSGLIRWTRSDHEIASVNIDVDVQNPDNASLVISARVDGEPYKQTLTLDAEPCRFGGLRFYFVCPLSGRRCTNISFAAGRWASPRALRLTYACQSETRLDRLYRARAKAQDRAFGDESHPKPRGRNRERLVAKWIQIEEVTDQLFAIAATRRFGKLFAP
jgi:hypothetical protein